MNRASPRFRPATRRAGGLDRDSATGRVSISRPHAVHPGVAVGLLDPVDLALPTRCGYAGSGHRGRCLGAPHRPFDSQTTSQLRPSGRARIVREPAANGSCSRHGICERQALRVRELLARLLFEHRILQPVQRPAARPPPSCRPADTPADLAEPAPVQRMEAGGRRHDDPAAQTPADDPSPCDPVSRVSFADSGSLLGSPDALERLTVGLLLAHDPVHQILRDPVMSFRCYRADTSVRFDRGGLRVNEVP
jgi:hypothetical protein